MNSGLLNGNGILGGWGRNNNYQTGAAAFSGGMAGGIIGAEIGSPRNYGYGVSPIDMKEINDQEFDLWEMGKIREEGLRNSILFREKDIAEKGDIYRQTLADNNRISDKLSDLKDFTVKGLADIYQASVVENKQLEREISKNQLESFKNVSDLYTETVRSDKNLELQIERNREKDQEEKFHLYRELNDKNTALAYTTMRQSYEDRMEAMNHINALSARVCALEKDQAVTAARLPLMFQLTESNTRGAISCATCHKMDGHLTITPNQISTPITPVCFSSNCCGC